MCSFREGFALISNLYQIQNGQFAAIVDLFVKLLNIWKTVLDHHHETKWIHPEKNLLDQIQNG